MEITPTTKIQYKIIDTTDDKYEGMYITWEGGVSSGDSVTFGDTSINVDKIEWVDQKTVKIISSNYIAVLEVINVIS